MQDSRPQRKVSVILPTYNEKGNILPLIQEIFKQTNRETEVIVVDDNSPDRTWEDVQELAKIQDDLHLIRRMNERGLVSALKTGIDNSKGEIIIWMDCDFSMPPHHIKDLLGCIDEGYDLAVASRFVKDGGVEIITKGEDSLLAYLMSWQLNKFIQFVLDSSLKDYTSGFIALKRNVLESIPLKGDYGEYFIDLIYRAIRKGFKVIEIPYVCKARRVGTSKTGTNIFHYFRKGIKYVVLTVKLRFIKIKKNGEKNG